MGDCSAGTSLEETPGCNPATQRGETGRQFNQKSPVRDDPPSPVINHQIHSSSCIRLEMI